MYKQDVIGELLYIGFVAEKGRCGGRWKIGYKKILKHHLNALSMLLDTMFDEKENINSVIKEFIAVSIKDSQIRKFYPFSDAMISQIENETMKWEENPKEFNKVNYLMKLLMNDAMTEINCIFTDRKKICNIIRSLHNLPRVYLGKGKITLCELNQREITQEEALEYAFNNMDEIYRKKYEMILNKYM